MVLVLNTCGENGARLRRGGIAVASCPSTEQLLDAEQLLDERLLAEQLLDASCPSTEQLLDAEQLLPEIGTSNNRQNCGILRRACS